MGSSSFRHRIALSRLTILGLDTSERLSTLLEETKAPLAGLWMGSLLVATIGCHQSLPSNLFVVFPESDALRIVFIKNRLPVLSRLILGPTQAEDQAAEIILTLRHLENTRALDRDAGRLAVMVLGASQEIERCMDHGLFEVVIPPPPWDSVADDAWLFALFDLVITSPKGQMAPLKRRAEFVAIRLRPVAYAFAGLFSLFTLWTAAENVRFFETSYSNKRQIETNLQKIEEQTRDAAKEILEFGVSPELVSRAIILEKNELSSAPSFTLPLHQLGEVISQQEILRLKSYTWRIVPPGEPVCIQGAKGSPLKPANVDLSKVKREVEVIFEILLPPSTQEKSRAQIVANLSVQLSGIEGIHLIRDQAKELDRQVLSYSKNSISEAMQSWCFSLSDKDASGKNSPIDSKS
jgi:hypothetical protein